MSILRAILNFFYEMLLGCRHDRLTRPFTIEQQTYKVCLDCGKHVYYSPDTMRPLSAREMRRMRAVQLGELKVVQVASATGSLKGESDSRAVA
jgi:hypothetical protein